MPSSITQLEQDTIPDTEAQDLIKQFIDGNLSDGSSDDDFTPDDTEGSSTEEDDDDEGSTTETDDEVGPLPEEEQEIVKTISLLSIHSRTQTSVHSTRSKFTPRTSFEHFYEVIHFTTLNFILTILCQAERVRLLTNQPNLEDSELTKLIENKWKQASTEEKHEYETLAETEKKQLDKLRRIQFSKNKENLPAN